MKLYRILLLFSLFTALSCNRESYNDFLIFNASSTRVDISGTDIYNNNFVQHSLEPGEEVTIASIRRFEREFEMIEPAAVFGEDFVMVNEGGDFYRSDVRDLSSWVTIAQEDRRSATYQYQLVLIDTGF